MLVCEWEVSCCCCLHYLCTLSSLSSHLDPPPPFTWYQSLLAEEERRARKQYLGEQPLRGEVRKPNCLGLRRPSGRRKYTGRYIAFGRSFAAGIAFRARYGRVLGPASRDQAVRETCWFWKACLKTGFFNTETHFWSAHRVHKDVVLMFLCMDVHTFTIDTCCSCCIVQNTVKL